MILLKYNTPFLILALLFPGSITFVPHSFPSSFIQHMFILPVPVLEPQDPSVNRGITCPRGTSVSESVPSLENRILIASASSDCPED